jgi:hypothetical protein
MRIRELVACAVLFVAGAEVGNMMPQRAVKAQEKPEAGNWILQPMNNSDVWAYLLNTQTGQMYGVVRNGMHQVKEEK